MENKKFFSILLVAATLTGGIVFYACGKKSEDPEPVKEGTKAAQELCDCFSKATSATADKACVDAVDVKKNKFTKSEDKDAFVEAYLKEVAKCKDARYTAYFTALGESAAATLCECYAAATNAADQQACIFGPMASMPVQVQKDPVFGTAFAGGVYQCNPEAFMLLCTLFGGCE